MDFVPRCFDIRVCRGPVCAGERQADAVHARLEKLLATRVLGAVITLERQSCFGRCRLGPNVHVRERLAPEPIGAGESPSAPSQPPRPLSAFYSGVGEDDADEILTSHVLGGQVVERLIHRIPAAMPPSEPLPDIRLASAPADAERPASGTVTNPEPSEDVAPDPR
jgi:(2Fe-2S) ferredoxin